MTANQTEGTRIVIQLPPDGAADKRASILVSNGNLSVIRRFQFTGYNCIAEETRSGVFDLVKLRKSKLPNFPLGPADEWTPDKDLLTVGGLVKITRTNAAPHTGEIIAIGPIKQGTETLLERGQFLVDVGAGKATGVICSHNDVSLIRPEKVAQKRSQSVVEQNSAPLEDAQLSLF